MKKVLLAVPLLFGAALALGAGEHGEKGKGKGMHKGAVTRAVCVLHPTAKSTVRGIVVFTQKNGYVEVKGKIVGLTPGKHGFHVHEFGDCTAPDGSSAGGHFDPDKSKHGGPEDKERHVGDLGNIDANAAGVAEFTRKDKMIALNGAHAIIGRGLIVHAKADDLKSQPSGDAGGRVACGVIGVAKSAAMPKKAK